MSADAHCCGQTYIDLYKVDPQPSRTNLITATLDYVLTGTYQDSSFTNDWWWIDAFFMATTSQSRIGGWRT